MITIEMFHKIAKILKKLNKPTVWFFAASLQEFIPF